VRADCEGEKVIGIAWLLP